MERIGQPYLVVAWPYVVHRWLYRAEREGVELRLELEEPSPVAMLDERALGGKLELCVSDRGSGIAKDDRRRIFERFVRGSNASPSVRGSDIGLALVSHIVEAHGGKAWVESELGEGSTFVVSIAGLHGGAEAPPSRAAPASRSA